MEMMRMKNKKGFVWGELGWWILGLAVLVLIIVGIILMRGKGFSVIDKILEVWRFGS